MEDDLPSEYDVIVIGTGTCLRPLRNFPYAWPLECCKFALNSLPPNVKLVNQ